MNLSLIYFTGLLVRICLANNRNEADSGCHLPPKKDSCSAYCPTFYYDASSGNCLNSVYDWKQTNANRFQTEEECMNRCAGADEENSECSQPPDGGVCYVYCPLFYYDPSSGTCRHFNFGNCGGNSNLFRTEEECMNKCGGQENENNTDCLTLPTGDPTCYYDNCPMFYYDTSSSTCMNVEYGGCGGKANRFWTEKECTDQCKNKDDVPNGAASEYSGIVSWLKVKYSPFL